MKTKMSRALMIVSVAILGWLAAGCESPDADNAAGRPWNSPTTWEHGLPVGLNEGR